MSAAVVTRTGFSAAPVPLAEVLGESAALSGLRRRMARLVQRQAGAERLPPVLIEGETGTGKGLLAHAIHRAGPRAAGPFVDVNCAAIPEGLLEAELFGFERGAFTDARQAKPGLFQAAHRGTIFLDEVGLMPEPLQAKLLKVLEERAVRRLGATRSEPVDIAIVAATREDLRRRVHERRFREDLYHRLAVLTVALPPLRQRGHDVLLLAEHFLARACVEYGLGLKTLSAPARAALTAYTWPGNVRELANLMERVALLSEGAEVTPALLDVPAAPPSSPAPPPTLDDAMRAHLAEVLVRTRWNISRAASVLGISRNTLRARIERHGLRPGRRGPAPPAPPALPASGTAPAPAAASGPPQSTTVRWDRRPIALLRIRACADAGAETARALEAAIEKVRAFGGRLDGLSANGLVGAFGIDRAEDAVWRAANAALAIQNAAGHARVGLRLGIHVGTLMVGRSGSTVQIDDGAKRDALVELERLLNDAEPGSILVDAAAAPFLDRRCELVAVAADASAYRLIERAGGNGRVGAGFVGRDQELLLLRDCFDAACRGHGRVVAISGEAGIGKSRLVAEFRRGLPADDATWLDGQCASFGEHVALLPVIDIVRRAAGVSDADASGTIAAKVRRSLADLDLAVDDTAPYLLHLLGVKEGAERFAALSPEAINVRTLELLGRLALAVARRRPLVVVVEDLHWIDPSSAEHLAALVERVPGAPILLLFTYRAGRRPAWLARADVTQMALQPLSRDESLSVLQTALPRPDVAGEMFEAIVAKADGNPFFLEEMARAVGQGPGAGRPVPDTIQAVLLSRIDALEEETRRVLQGAAVLGREVPLRLLEAMQTEPGSLDAHVAGLTRLEFLREQADGGERVYAFTHALTQEVAYASLGDEERRELHVAAGRALESVYGSRLDDALDRLAYHWARTTQSGPAVRYLTAAADRAARTYSNTEAIALLEQALTHAARLPAPERERRRVEIVLRLAHSLFFVGRFQDAERALDAERPRVEGLADPTLSGRYYFQLGHTWSLLGEHERAVTYAERALSEATACRDRTTIGKTLFVLARDGFWSGSPRTGAAHGRRAIQALDGTDEHWWLGMAHWALGINHAVMGEFEAALAATARAREIGEAIGDPRLTSYAAWTSGGVYAARGEAAAAIAACRHGLERSPDPINTANALGFLGYAHLEAGDAAAAVPALEQSVRQLATFRSRQGEGWFTAWLAEAELLAGRPAEARRLAARALELTSDVRFFWGVGVARRALGRVAHVEGHLAEAERWLAEALEQFAAIEARFDVARTQLARAETARARGAGAETAARLRGALAAFDALGVASYAARTRARAAEWDIVV